MFREPRQSYPEPSDTRSKGLNEIDYTIVETFTDLQPALRISHLHPLLVHPKPVDSLLRERHEQQIQSHTSDSIVFRVDISIPAPFSVLFRFAFPFREF